VADDEGLALLDLADLRSMLVWLADNADTVARQYGNVATSSVGAIQRALLVLENQGAASFFGEPALDLADLMATGSDGEGRVNILMADKLMGAPRVYSMFLLWLLSELFETLPEVGNPEKPVLVFFFDEAHLLFDSAPRALIDRIEQMVRLIRSKGVGVYFVTQNPDDVPPDVLGQLGNRIQHALRAYTPREAKALRAAAQTFRPNPAFDTETAIREVGTGEAVVSLLQDKAVPGMVERTLIRPPTSRMGPLTEPERQAVMAASPVAGRYDTAQDPVSAHEILAQRAAAAAQAAASLDRAFDAVGTQGTVKDGGGRRYGGPNSPAPTRSAPSRARSDPTLGQALAKTFARQLSSRQGQAMVRGLLGSLFKGR
jgi:DNA helicase HerA-like ATPase